MIHYLNLINPELRPRRVFPSAAHIASAVLAVAAGMFAWAGYATYAADRAHARLQALDAQLKSQRTALATLGKELAERKPDPALASELARAERMLQSRDEITRALDSLSGGSAGPGFSSYLKAFARQSLPGLWLTGFEIGTAGNDMVINGRTLNAELVPQYLRRLNTEQSFRGREFSTLTMGVPDAAKPAPDGRVPAVRPPAVPYVEFSLAGLTAAVPERKQ